MRVLKLVSDGVYKVEAVLATIFISLMFISLSLGVFFRYILNNPLIWSEEIAIFSLIWLTFIGASMGLKRQETAAVGILIDKLTGKLKRVLFGIGIVFLLVFLIYILYLSVQWISSPNIFVQFSNSLKLPMVYVYLSVPVSFLFMIIHSLELLFKNIFNHEEGELC